MDQHADSKNIKNVGNVVESEDEDITWSQVFNMMYTDAREIISPISRIVNYVAPDPNEEDSRQAKAAFEERMSRQVKQPIRKYKMGSPGAIHVVDEATGEVVSIPRRENLQGQPGSGGDAGGVQLKRRGLTGGLREESAKSPMDIIDSAQNIESFYKTVQDGEKGKVCWGPDWDLEGGSDSSSGGGSSPGIKNTPSTQCNTDSSPCKEFAKGSKGGRGDVYGDVSEVSPGGYEKDDHGLIQGMGDIRINGCHQDGKVPGSELVIPRLSLSEKRRSISKKYSEEDLSAERDQVSLRVHSERRLTGSRSRFERAPHGNYHSHAYTMENLSGTIHRPITTSREEILKLYSKEELERIQSFVEKTNDLVYEGPLEKKNSWSWGYKLRWVRIYKCEMHYFLSPNESKLKTKTPLGVINFKVAEWSLQVSDSDEKTFTIVARGNTSNGRRYQWRVPSNSDQNRKSWTTRIEKILKAAAFMQQLKGIIRIPA
ncbi:pleckstrin homology (PH) domain-containing protein [Cryptosporidium canis]|uniref:Pleckstrin homology (PH) domain-containing protein n=1 Tax=Cryptosporidium canis TaxID=195482 RepID=A0ABQ8P8D5_9CRYT|nr:pleckstrin homology (PH) domain-containing protein [Cryptosporidium canis]